MPCKGMRLKAELTLQTLTSLVTRVGITIGGKGVGEEGTAPTAEPRP